MQVLHLNDERASLAAIEAHLHEGCKGVKLDRLRTEHRQPVRLSWQPQELEEIRGHLFRGHADLLETLVHLCRDHLGAVRVSNAAVVPEKVQYREIGRHMAVREALPL